MGIFTLDSISNPTIVNIILLYLVYYSISLGIAALVCILGYRGKLKLNFVTAVILGPLFEEGACRWLPVMFFGIPGLQWGTLVWLVLHGWRAVIIFPAGFLLYRLWVSDLGWVALLVHIFTNFVAYIAYRISKRRIEKKERPTVPEPVRYAIEQAMEKFGEELRKELKKREVEK